MALTLVTRLDPWEAAAQIGGGGPASAERGLQPRVWRVGRSQERTWR